MRVPTLPLACFVLALGSAVPAAANEAWNLEAVYTADVTGVLQGGAAKAGRYLDNLDITLDGDLGAAVGWDGATFHVHVLNNLGGRPNDVAGTLQGVDNIEVAEDRLRLYELWIEQSLAGGRASLRAGLYDLNSEFYATEASDLLISPPFGIGSELASTGPNGPSIFPLTSVAARLRIGGETGSYVQAAALSAQAGAFNAPDDLQMGLDRGAILIAEAGHVGRVRVAAGGWTYTQQQDDLRGGRSEAFGGYVLAEGAVWGDDDGRQGRAFLRVGLSDGDTTPFNGGWQAGLRVDRVFAGRPDSAFSVGVHQAYLSDRFRENVRAGGIAPSRSESAIEVTYSDTIGRLSIQPDLQFIRHPGGERDRRTAIVGALRLTVALD